MFTPALTREYRQSVLSRRLAGPAMLDSVKSSLAAAKQSPDFSLVQRANASLLWHMAHCPIAADRAQLLGLASGFETDLSNINARMPNNYIELVHEPMPHSPAIGTMGLSDSLWFIDCFKNIEIAWNSTGSFLARFGGSFCDMPVNMLKKLGVEITPTHPADFAKISEALRELKLKSGQASLSDLSFLLNLLQQQGLSPKGLILVLRGETPGFQGFFADNGQLENPLSAYNIMKMALAIRNRSIVNITNGLFMDFLSIPQPNEMTHLNWQTLKIIGYLFDTPAGRHFLALLLKNSLPIGYGFSFPSPFSNDATIGFHIFREYRGTPDSHFGFDAFLSTARDELTPDRFLIQREIVEADVDIAKLPKEDQVALTTFYKAHGFNWLQQNRNYMARDAASII